MEAELAGIASGDIADTLRAYRAGELLRIGVSDLIHSAGLKQTQGETERSGRSDSQDATAAHGESATTGARRMQSGGRQARRLRRAGAGQIRRPGNELRLDLDVTHFCRSDGQTDDGLPAVSYFAELAQGLTRAMKASTALARCTTSTRGCARTAPKRLLALSPGRFQSAIGRKDSLPIGNAWR